MELRYKVDVSAAVQVFEGLSQRAGDPEPILKRWGGYFKWKAGERQKEAAGWPGLAESTRKKYEQTRTSSVTRAGGVRQGYASRLETYLARQQKRGSASAAGDLQELRRLRAGGRVMTKGAKGKPADWGGGAAVDRLRKRLARAEKQRDEKKWASVGGSGRKLSAKKEHKLLGSIPKQVVWRVEGTKVRAVDRVPWAGVHNEGGAAGRGASEPERVFLVITEEDKVELAKIVEQQLLGLPR